MQPHDRQRPDIQSTVVARLRRSAELYDAKRFAEAESDARHAVSAAPDLSYAHLTLGYALAAQGRWDEAIEAYRAAAQRRPVIALAHTNLGVALFHRGRHAEAIAAYRNAIELDARDALAHSNLGEALGRVDRLEEAAAVSRRATQLDPGNSTFANNLASLLARLGQYDEALAASRRAIELDPSNAPAHHMAGLTLLKLGRWREAWPEFEWRRHGRAAACGRHTWDGSPLNGRSIVLRAEQGFGDTIQFIRYAPMVKSRGAGRVIVECARPLRDLLKTTDGVDEAYVQGEAPPVELEVSMMSLPHRFGTEIETIPANVPYVRADPARIQRLSALMAGEALKLGLAWAGNPQHTNDRFRSCPLQALAPLRDVAGVQLYSLQKGPAAQRDRETVRVMGLVDLGEACDDFADLAAAMSLLDLVISVDTAPAHLAGALTKPTWLLLPHLCEWRWLRDRSDTPWYPTMRLFHQPSPGDWSAVAATVAAELHRLHCTRT